MKRLVNLSVFTLLALSCCFGLFVLMASLIKDQGHVLVEAKPNVVIEFVEQAKDSKLNVRQPLKPIPKLVNNIVKPTKLMPTDTETDVIDFEISKPSGIGNSLDGFSLSKIGDNEARPVVRVSPKYPIDAQREGKEGWVQLSFSIDATGSVVDIKVIDAKPARIFNKEAVRALKKWKYKAQYIDGKPTVKSGLSVVLEFKMNSEPA